MNRFLNKSANLLLLALYTLSITGLVAGSFGYTVHGSLYLWLAGLCVSVWISAHFRRGLLLGLPLSALLLYAACRSYGGSLPAQLADALDMAVAAYRQRFGSTASYVGVLTDKSHDLVLLFLAFLLASYLSTGISSHRWRVFFSLTGSLPPFALCVAVNGEPPVWAVAGLLLFWTLLLVGGDRYDPESARGRSVYAAALPALLLLGLLLAPLGPESYDLTEEDVARSRRFDSVMNFVRRLLDSGEGLSLPGVSLSPVVLPAGTPGGGEAGSSETEAPEEVGLPAGAGVFSGGGTLDLSRGYDFSAAKRTALHARGDASGTVYLRGVSYGDYTGSGWGPAPEPDLPSSLPYAAQAAALAGGEEHSLEIRPEGEPELMFLPYFCQLAGDSDWYVPRKGGSSYRTGYVSLSADPASILPPGRPEELAYRAFAQASYTRLPEDTLAWAQELLAAEGLGAGTPDLVQRVAEYVQNAAVYDLSIGAFASDDYARTFLTEARRGYCVHFATAAAVLYRALGLPARVAEGYVFQSEPGQTVDVTGADAHAWVELYYSGFGWVPVEVTGSIGIPAEEERGTPAPATPSPAAPPAAGSETEPGETEPVPASPSPSRPPARSPAVGIVSGEYGSAPVEHAGGFPWRTLGRVLAGLLAAALAAGLLPLQRALRLCVRRRRFRQKDCGKAVLAIWRAARRLPGGEAGMPEGIAACAEKAVFSRHKISSAERDACLALYEEAVRGLSSRSGPLKRFWYRYGNCIM